MTPRQSGPLAVSARRISYSYGSRQALAGLDFDVSSGEIFGVLGPNGGGKTTLFRILATLQRLQAGTLRVFGCDLREEPALVRLQLGVVFQTPSVDLQLSVEENLVHQGHLYGLRGGELHRQIGAGIERFGLGERRKELVTNLSGGLRRRVEIVKALMHRPRLLLLDEPSTGLDPGARRELWEVLEELRAEQDVTVLLTTHFMEEGDRCDRLALVDRGHIVASGRPLELKEEIGGDVVTVTSRDPQTFARRLADHFDLTATVHDGVVRFEKERAHEFVSRMVESFPGEIEALTVAKPTLEDVFLRRAGHRLWEEG